MPFDFPSSGLTVGQQVTAPTGAVYVWDGVAWRPVSVPLPPYAPLTSPVFSGDPQVPLAPVGDADQSIASTQFVTRAVAPAINNVGRNLLHNPLFNVAQRGQGPFTAMGYTQDRWYANFVSDTISWIQAPISDSERSAIGDEAAFWALQNTFTGNAAAGAYNEIWQAIEFVRRLSGKTITISFWAVASAALRLGIQIAQNFGTGGSPSGSVGVLATGASVTLSTTWTRYTLPPIAIPSAVGKTLGTNNNDNTQIRFALSCGATNNQYFGNVGVQSGTVKIWGIQLEIGSVATPLDYGGTPQQQIAQCQRFYQPFYQALVSGYGGAGGAIFLDLSLGVTMRANPTVTFANITSSNASGLTMNSSQFNHVKLQSAITAAGSGYQQADIIISADL